MIEFLLALAAACAMAKPIAHEIHNNDHGPVARGIHAEERDHESGRRTP